MISQSPIDALFHVGVAGLGTGAGARGGPSGAAFGEHLSQASAPPQAPANAAAREREATDDGWRETARHEDEPLHEVTSRPADVQPDEDEAASAPVRADGSERPPAITHTLVTADEVAMLDVEGEPLPAAQEAEADDEADPSADVTGKVELVMTLADVNTLTAVSNASAMAIASADVTDVASVAEGEVSAPERPVVGIRIDNPAQQGGPRGGVGDVEIKESFSDFTREPNVEPQTAEAVETERTRLAPKADAAAGTDRAARLATASDQPAPRGAVAAAVEGEPVVRGESALRGQLEPIADESSPSAAAKDSRATADATRHQPVAQAAPRTETGGERMGAQNAGPTVAAPAAISIDAAAAVEAVEEQVQQAVKTVIQPVDAGGESLAAGRTPNSATTERGARAAAADDLPPVDAARFVGRVARAFQTAQERGGTLQLRLSPPELGSLRLELSLKEGVLTAALETETAAARRVLLDHLPALRDRLAEQNIRVERFDVDVRRDGSGQADQRAMHDRQQDQPNDGPPPRRSSASPRSNEPAPRREAAISGSNNTGINLVA